PPQLPPLAYLFPEPCSILTSVGIPSRRGQTIHRVENSCSWPSPWPRALRARAPVPPTSDVASLGHLRRTSGDRGRHPSSPGRRVPRATERPGGPPVSPWAGGRADAHRSDSQRRRRGAAATGAARRQPSCLLPAAPDRLLHLLRYLTYRAIIEKRQGWPWVYGPAAYLFNPIVPVRLSRDRKRRG